MKVNPLRLLTSNNRSHLFDMSLFQSCATNCAHPGSMPPVLSSTTLCCCKGDLSIMFGTIHRIYFLITVAGLVISLRL